MRIKREVLTTFVEHNEIISKMVYIRKRKDKKEMKLEKLKESHLKRNILIGIVIIGILITIVLTFTKARYRVTESIPLVNGTINYDLADLNAVAVYIEDGDDYSKSDTIPSSGYTLNEEKSYCTVNGEEDSNITVSYDANTQSLSVSPLTTQGTKCTLYFNEQVFAKDTILANYSTVKTRTFPLTVSSTVTGNTTGVIYKSANSNQYDDYGEVYYFAGNPTDNWVKWAGFYWRIIRINGDGSIRMIYQGTSANTTGTNTQLQTSAFHSSYDRSEYVGLKYTSGQQHGTGSNSTIMGVLNTWYQNNLQSYADDIDTNVGFCSDRNMASGSSWSSQPSSTIYYAAYGRLVQNNSSVNPSFKCSNSGDLLQIPVGLITADEVSMAGLPWSGSTTNNYLYTGEYYWTLSPCAFSAMDSSAEVFRVYADGRLANIYVDWAVPGVRPVVNLKADVTISGGNGTMNNPYVLSGN